MENKIKHGDHTSKCDSPHYVLNWPLWLPMKVDMVGTFFSHVDVRNTLNKRCNNHISKTLWLSRGESFSSTKVKHTKGSTYNPFLSIACFAFLTFLHSLSAKGSKGVEICSRSIYINEWESLLLYLELRHLKETFLICVYFSTYWWTLWFMD